jgi:hypothetical protein
MERAFLRRLVSLRWHRNCGGGHGGRRSLAELGDVQVGGGSECRKARKLRFNQLWVHEDIDHTRRTLFPSRSIALNQSQPCDLIPSSLRISQHFSITSKADFKVPTPPPLVVTE